MVMEWGMSEKLGRVRYAGNEQEVFLGHSVTQTTNMSEGTAQLVDSEIRTLIEGGEQTARRILHERIDDLHALANALLEYETLSGDEVAAIFRGEKIVREAPDEPQSPSTPSSSVPSAGRPRGPDNGIGVEPQPSP
jgi:cell division protease FtsH